MTPALGFDISANMEMKAAPRVAPFPALDAAEAAQAFAALGSEPRLEVVRALVRAGPEGLPVGALQARLGIAASTLSHHLRFLAAAGLLTQERQGRSLICRAAFPRIDRLADFLRRECCADLSRPRAEDPRT